MKRFFFLLAALLSTAGLFAQQIDGDPAVRKGTLDNGLTYYIRHNALPAQRAEFYLATDIGAIQEAPDQDGLAHFLEHMCFNGTKNFPGKGILNYLQSIGASFGGNVNASTGVEQTVYMLTNIPLVNDSVVDSCLLIIHDYSHFVSCDPKEIDAERGVILEERRTRNTADWRMFEKSLPYLFGDTKYSTCNVIGSEENLKNFKPESLVNFYQTWCRPDLQAVIVVGDIDVDEIEAKIRNTWADIPKPENPKAKDVITIPDNEEPIVGVITDPENTTCNFDIYWKRPARDKALNNMPQGLVEDMLYTLIYRVMSERLTDIIAKDNAPFVNASFSSASNICKTTTVTNMSVLFVEGEWEKALDAAIMEAEKLRRFGVGDAELERAKSKMLAAYESEANKADTRKNPEFIYPLLYNFLDNDEYMTPQDKLQFANAILPQIKAPMLANIAAKLITDNNLVVLYTAPEKEGLATPTPEQIKEAILKARAADIQANVEEEVAANFIDPSTLPGAKIKKVKSSLDGAVEWTLSNGVKVALHPTDQEKDKISINLYKKGGQSLIATEDMPSFDRNIASVFGSKQGVAEFPATEVRKMLAGKNCGASYYINGYTHGVTAHSNVKDLETAFQLLYLEFCQPRFDENEFGQAISMLEPLVANLENMPQMKLQKAINDYFYGNNPRHPMISPELLQQASLQSIEKVHKELFKDAAGAVVTIVGDFDIDSIKPLVEKYIGSLPKGKKAQNWSYRGDGVVDDLTTIEFRTKMEMPKVTVVQLYKANEKFRVENDAAFDALNYILNMIYTDTLREDEGGTYGASSAVSVTQAPNENIILEVAFETNDQQADRLRELAKDGLRGLAENGPSDDYFDKAQKNLLKKIPEAKIRNIYISTGLEQWYLYGIDHNALYEKAVNELTAADVQKAAQLILNSGMFGEIVMRPETAE